MPEIHGAHHPKGLLRIPTPRTLGEWLSNVRLSRPASGCGGCSRFTHSFKSGIKHWLFCWT